MTRTTDVDGRVDVQGTPCVGSACPAGMAFRLQSGAISFPAGFMGFHSPTIEDVVVGGAGLPNTLTLDAAGHGEYPTNSMQAWARGTAVEHDDAGNVTGRDTAAFLLVPTAPTSVSVDWAARTFSVSGAFDLPSGEDPDSAPSVSVVTDVSGVILNTPPTVDITTPPTVECTSPAGAEFLLSAAITDADADDDLFSTWRRGPQLDGDPTLSHRDSLTLLQAPLTSEIYSIRVLDAHFQQALDAQTVAVVDTRAPRVSGLHARPQCMATRRHEWLRLSLGEELLAHARDVCDPSPLVRIIDVEAVDDRSCRADGPEILFGESGLCLRARRGTRWAGLRYRVTLQAEDRAGNTTTAELVVRVPHDADDRCRDCSRNVVDEAEALSACSFGPVVRPPSAPPAPPRVIEESAPRPGHHGRWGRSPAHASCAVSARTVETGSWVLTVTLLVTARRRRRRLG